MKGGCKALYRPMRDLTIEEEQEVLKALDGLNAQVKKETGTLWRGAHPLAERSNERLLVFSGFASATITKCVLLFLTGERFEGRLKEYVTKLLCKGVPSTQK